MEKKRLLMDQDAIMRAIRRISHEILERNKGLSNALIVGIERRGVILAKRLQAEIERIEGIHIDCESLNVAVYRDDRDARPKEGEPCTIDTTEKTIILVDDVLYTGRTIRAALNALMTAGRPRSIQLAVLVDRGHRELPIRADYVGKNIPTSHLESVRVAVADLDGHGILYLPAKVVILIGGIKRVRILEMRVSVNDRLGDGVYAILALNFVGIRASGRNAVAFEDKVLAFHHIEVLGLKVAGRGSIGPCAARILCQASVGRTHHKGQIIGAIHGDLDNR